MVISMEIVWRTGEEAEEAMIQGLQRGNQPEV